LNSVSLLQMKYSTSRIIWVSANCDFRGNDGKWYVALRGD
jgi:hypothetical protein